MDGRKKPGRPRKYPLKKHAQRNGVGEVINAANMVELVYDSIASFKAIFLLFKSMAAKDLCMEFRPNALHIYATDHLNKSNARVIIDCQKANHYYCAEPHKIFLEPTSIEKIIQTLDKMHNFIHIIVKAADRNNSITFIFKNDLKIDECHEISTIQLGSELPVANFDPVAYPIQLSMPSKYLKKFINDSSCFSDSINICKVGLEPLVFGYTSRDRIVKSRRIVTSGEMVDLVSTVADGEIFSVSILLEHVKPISTIMISEKITIFADVRQNLILSMKSDDGSMAIDTSISIVAI